MPLLEVLTTRSMSEVQKRALVKAADEAVEEILGTPRGRLHVVCWPLASEQTHEGLRTREVPDTHEEA